MPTVSVHFKFRVWVADLSVVPPPMLLTTGGVLSAKVPVIVLLALIAAPVFGLVLPDMYSERYLLR